MACYFLNDSSKQSNAAGKFTRWLQSKKQTRILTCCFPQIPSYHYKKGRHLPWPMPLWKEQMVGKYYGNRQNITVAAGNVFFSLFFSFLSFFFQANHLHLKTSKQTMIRWKNVQITLFLMHTQKAGIFFFFLFMALMHICNLCVCLEYMHNMRGMLAITSGKAALTEHTKRGI